MKSRLIVVPIIFILAACGDKKDNPTPGSTPEPTAATLSVPAQNAVCTSGTILSTTESTIAFSWTASDNTSSYMLVVKNLLTHDSTAQNTTQTQVNVTLPRSTPFSWYIVSQSDKTSATAKSDVWKFYNSGPGATSYAPFPADITSPTFGQLITAPAGMVNLKWTGSVVAPDVIASYDVYFGTTTSPAIKASAITDSFLLNVTVAANTTYYWHVTTRDINGNTSDSGLYQFSVN